MQTMHFLDCRQLALVIANAYPCGYLEFDAIGVAWSPRDPGGRPWTKHKCAHVLEQLLTFRLCSIHDTITGHIVRVTGRGYRELDISGTPAISDLDSARGQTYPLICNPTAHPCPAP